MPRRLKEFSAFKTVRDLIINNSKEFKDNVAFIQQTEGNEGSLYKSITFSEFFEDWKYLCHIFRKAGIKKGDRVALIGNNSYPFTLAFLTLASGIGVPAVLPNLFTKEAIAKNCERINASFAICDSSELSLVPDGIKVIRTDDISALINEEKRINPELLLDAVTIDDYNDEAIIVFTSGNENTVKACVATNRQIYENVSLVRNEIYISYSERFLSLSHMSFYYEIYCGLFFPMSRGASVIYLNSVSGKSDMIATDIRTQKPTITVVSPQIVSEFYTLMWSTLVSDGKIEDAQNYIQLVNSAGKIRRGLKQNIMDELKKIFGDSLNFIMSSGNMLTSRIDDGMRAFGIPIINVYGTAECPIAALKSPFAPGSGEKSYIPTEVNLKTVPVKGENFGKLMISGTRVSKNYADGTPVGEWLDTNDYGTIDEERVLTLIGKDYNAYRSEQGGRLICPEQIERTITTEYGITEAHVYPELLSDGRTVLSARVRPDPSLTMHHGAEFSGKLALDAVSKINSILLPHKKLKNVEIVFSPASLDRAHRKERPSNNEITVALLSEDEVFSSNKK